MISKMMFVGALIVMSFTTQAIAAPHAIENIEDAKAVMVALAEELGSENDANAVFVANGAQSKSLLIEILKGENKTQDIPAVQQADFLGVIVENNDEAVITYYVLNKGQIQALQVGPAIAVADLEYYVCPTGQRESSLPRKFGKVKNLLLGLNPQASVQGTVWFEDFDCEEE